MGCTSTATDARPCLAAKRPGVGCHAVRQMLGLASPLAELTWEAEVVRQMHGLAQQIASSHLDMS